MIKLIKDKVILDLEVKKLSTKNIASVDLRFEFVDVVIDSGKLFTYKLPFNLVNDFYEDVKLFSVDDWF